MARKKKREVEEDSFLDEEIADDWDDVESDDEAADDTDESADAEEDEAAGSDETDESEETEVQAEEPVPVEEEIDYPPDDKKAVAALEKLRVRLDVSEKGNVWRVIFDDANGKDPALLLLAGLPALRELWLLGTKITEGAAKKFKEDHPKITVYY